MTDHKPLLAILGEKKGIPSLVVAQLQRWAVLLSAYQYEIRFKPTQEHANADGLSRLPIPTTTGSKVICSADPAIFNLSQVEALPVTATQNQAATRTDPVLSKVLHHTRHGWPQHIAEVLKAFHQRSQELTVEVGCIILGIWVVISKKLQARILEDLHRDHPGASRMKSLARSHFRWPGWNKQIESHAMTKE